jgi:dihydrolipoamide dehydrogenase
MHIVVLGGGPGGYQAAFEAARLGADVTLVEKAPEELGGTCLNWGCIPTKTILRTAHIARDTQRGQEFALDVEPAAVDVQRLRERKEGVVRNLRDQITGSAKRLRVEIVYGAGRLVGPKTIDVSLDEGGTSTIDGDAVILATGSVVFELPGIDHDLERVWTSDDAVSLSGIPSRILIIGGGIIGLEFACAYAAFGSNVTVVELMPTIMPGNDKRVTRAVQKSLEEQGVAFHLGQKVESIEETDAGVRVTLDSGETIETDVVMSAVGRMPNSQGLGYPDAGVELDRAAVKVDEYFRTSVEGVYAIGDLIGGMMLAHVAEEEGVIAARNAWAEFHTVGAHATLESMDYETVPACVYTFPEVAIVGTGRDSAKERGLDVAQSVVKFAANGKALAEGEAEGFVQMVAEKGTGRIVGCQIVGPHAVEIVHEVAIAMRAGMTVAELGHATHAHPTVSEVVKMAAAAVASQV